VQQREENLRMGRSFETTAAAALPAPGPAAGGDDLERLVERLIRTASAAAGRDLGPARGSRQPDEQVLLDLELLGVRCLLVRRAARAAALPGAAPGAKGAPPAAGPLVALSPREREIARMVALGYPNKTIAGVLEISSWTVSTHLRRIFAKLGVTSRAAMAAQLAAAGLIDLAR
jgi:DNA-binding CsgD family transcriptional regulator